MLRAVRDNALSNLFLVLFALAIVGQSIAGFLQNNERLSQHAQPPVGFLEFISSSEFVVDVAQSEVRVGDLRVPASIPPSSREALITGSWDATGLLLADYPAVERAAARLPYLNGFH